MTTFKLTLEYDGTKYSGWQEQPNVRTVQGVLRAAAEGHLGKRVEIGGSGRTDAGVHALAQVAHLRVQARVEPHRLFYGINDLLPADVNVLAVEPAGERFHARHDAVGRSYLYQIATRRTAFGKKYVWWVKDSLDERAMAAAAGLFVGRHDFGSFSDRSDEGGSREVVVSESVLVRHGDLLLYRVGASHFLWKMVRRIVGSLVEVGRGRLAPEDVARLLETYSRELAPRTAPPSGLFLERVQYSERDARRALAPAFALGG